MKESKKCAACKKIKSRPEFYKDRQQADELKPYCKKCNDEIVKKYYINNRDKMMVIQKTWAQKNLDKRNGYSRKYQKQNKDKCYARYTLGNAIQNGKIKKRNSCEICYASPTHCHHEDYSRPLDFVELCIRCHKFLHARYVY